MIEVGKFYRYKDEGRLGTEDIEDESGRPFLSLNQGDLCFILSIFECYRADRVSKFLIIRPGKPTEIGVFATLYPELLIEETRK